MKGNAEVIRVLNDILTAELTAINQYFVHAQMCENWGYERLYEKIKKESIEEMKHAEALIERILFLDGVPNVQRLGKISIGQTVAEQLRLDLDVELDAVKRLNDGVRLCAREGDAGSEELLRKILVEEEEHVDLIEAQLVQIEQMGEAQYLGQQIG